MRVVGQMTPKLDQKRQGRQGLGVLLRAGLQAEVNHFTTLCGPVAEPVAELQQGATKFSCITAGSVRLLTRMRRTGALLDALTSGE